MKYSSGTLTYRLPRSFRPYTPDAQRVLILAYPRWPRSPTAGPPFPPGRRFRERIGEDFQATTELLALRSREGIEGLRDQADRRVVNLLCAAGQGSRVVFRGALLPCGREAGSPQVNVGANSVVGPGAPRRSPARESERAKPGFVRLAIYHARPPQVVTPGVGPKWWLPPR